MLKAVVFDMDETLLDINLSAFVVALMRDEASLLARIGRKSTVTTLAAVGRALVALNSSGHDGKRTNRQIYNDAIRRYAGVILDDPVVACALEYYEREVLPKKNDRIIHARPMPGAHEALEAVAARGLRVALLTNPSFSSACIACRMGWARIADYPFELVTHMENSRYCKPDAAYYRESLDKLGLQSSEVLMVGNDPKRDFPAPDMGLQTAYVGGGVPERATWCGRMADFAPQLDRILDAFAARERTEL